MTAILMATTLLEWQSLSLSCSLTAAALSYFTAAVEACEACYSSDDYREGVAAFITKRAAEFKGS